VEVDVQPLKAKAPLVGLGRASWGNVNPEREREILK